MAHAANIEIPAEFVFRPYRANWVIGTVETVDWALEDSIDVELRQHNPHEDPAPELIEARLRYVSAVRTVGNGERLYPGEHECIVKLLRTSLPPNVLVRWENERTQPDISGRIFQILVHANPVIKEYIWTISPGDLTKDAWQMRDEFLNLEQDIVVLQNFLNTWGLWDRGLGYETGFSGKPQGFLICYPHDLWREQAALRNALMGDRRKWLSGAASLLLRKLRRPPYFTVDHSLCGHAIRSTITFDHLSKVTFGICRREDCRKLFQRTSEQKRLYCTQECAHLANIRKLRAAKRKAELKRRSHGARKG